MSLLDKICSTHVSSSSSSGHDPYESNGTDKVELNDNEQGECAQSFLFGQISQS